jgi:uncharacterized membrane protein YhaH (DUF805 family)
MASVSIHTTPVNLPSLLFAFRGRRNRGKFWLIFLLIPVLAFVWVLSVLLFGIVSSVDPIIAGCINVLGFVIAVWAQVANVVQRLHDINWSGWWGVLFYALSWTAVPMIMMTVESRGLLFALGILSFAIIAAVGAQPGTVGPNKYGPDPLAKVAKAV